MVHLDRWVIGGTALVVLQVYGIHQHKPARYTEAGGVEVPWKERLLRAREHWLRSFMLGWIGWAVLFTAIHVLFGKDQPDVTFWELGGLSAWIAVVRSLERIRANLDLEEEDTISAEQLLLRFMKRTHDRLNELEDACKLERG